MGSAANPKPPGVDPSYTSRVAEKLHFKFRERTGRVARDRVLRELRDCGAKDVRRLLPGERDRELAALYTVVCGGEASPEDLLARLRRAPEVEFVESAPRRRPVRPR